jgi:hypothetical protein
MVHHVYRCTTVTARSSGRHHEHPHRLSRVRHTLRIIYHDREVRLSPQNQGEHTARWSNSGLTVLTLRETMPTRAKPRPRMPRDPKLQVEHFLSQMFGKTSTHGLAAALEANDRVWRQYCKKLMDNLERYVTANVLTDKQHWRQITENLASLKSSLRLPADTREPYLVSGLVGLCLLLLGGLPDHWAKKRVGARHHFPLDQCRSLHYTQSASQRHHMIRTELQKKGALPIVSEVNTQSSAARRSGQYHQFLEWFKTTHPREYSDLFC